MKIPLHSGNGGGQTTAAARSEALEKDIQAAQRGDWKARQRIESMMITLLTDLARKRASSNSEINVLIEAGKQGIAIAVKKYKTSMGADRFQIFALRFIEAKMDNPDSGGFFARLFGG